MSSVNIFSSVGIIGCGWLGTPLARTLLAQDIDTFVTRSSADKVALLTEQAINGEVLLLPAKTTESIEQLKQHRVFRQKALVIAITPQFKQGKVDYGDKIMQLVDAGIHQGCVKRIILLSSSAVYNGLTGEVTEESVLDFSADKVQILAQAEKAVLAFGNNNNNKNRKSYVLRLAGLVGPNRHPGKFLHNGRMIESPEALVNLIHQQDALGLLISLLTTDTNSGIFNGVSQTHVSKKDYYQAAAKALSLPVPTFSDKQHSAGIRIVSGNKAQQLLSYQFVYPDLLTWL